ncbi:MAG: glycosyltransferase [Paracoccaceae bacterium]|nr:glycosyltransferase [Paracoccaceae bacterium]
MRNAAVTALIALQKKFRVEAPTDRVSQQDYYHEMLASRFIVSPFGFGELCWRDFESILCGSVLVKPDMSHVETWPDMFVAGETYVPVKWDFSDLEVACAPLQHDEAARAKMAKTALNKLLNAHTVEAFLERVDYTMREAGIG